MLQEVLASLDHKERLDYPEGPVHLETLDSLVALDLRERLACQVVQIKLLV